MTQSSRLVACVAPAAAARIEWAMDCCPNASFRPMHEKRKHMGLHAHAGRLSAEQVGSYVEYCNERFGAGRKELDAL